MNKYIKSLVIFVFVIALFAYRTSFADSKQIILKDGQSYKDISFKKGSLGEVFYKNILLFEGGEGYSKDSPRSRVQEIFLIDLQKKYYIFACANYYCAGYLVDKNSGKFTESFGQKYSYPNFFTETKDGRYALLYYYFEDQEATDNSVNLVLIDTENLGIILGKHLENGLPKNFIIDDKYQFSFEDKTGVVKGNLLDFFKKEPDTNVPTNNGVINTTIAPNIPNKSDDFNPISIIILFCLIALVYFTYKKLNKKN